MRTLSLNEASKNLCGGRDFLIIGCTPANEVCTSATFDDTNTDGIKECEVLANQIRRLHGNEPEDCEFFLLKNYHDFGVYYELAIFYNFSEEDMESKSENYALSCESLPEKWDKKAIEELTNYGYFINKQEKKS